LIEEGRGGATRTIKRELATHMPLILRLAWRNLFQDRMRFIGNLTGISVSIVLVALQMGLLLSFEGMITTMVQHASADLWILPQGTKSFEDPAILDEHQRFRALSVNGVIDAVPLVTGFTQWRVPGGALT